MNNNKNFNSVQWFSFGQMMGELIRVVEFIELVINNKALSKKIQNLANYSYELAHEVQDERQNNKRKVV